MQSVNCVINIELVWLDGKASQGRFEPDYDDPDNDTTGSSADNHRKQGRCWYWNSRTKSHSR